MLKVMLKIILTSYQNVQEKTMKIPYQSRLLQSIYILIYHILSDWRLWITGLKTTEKVYVQDLTKNLFQNVQKVILQNNNMKFNNKFYNQSKGTVMWTIFAPTYATLSIGYIEIKLYSICTFKHGELLAEYIKENQSRFLDNCYTVLRNSQISPEELLLTLNSINPSIQFTMEYSKDQILFLDILIKRNENGIWMDLYHKPTDTQRCLHPVTQTIVNKISHFVQQEGFALLQKTMLRS